MKHNSQHYKNQLYQIQQGSRWTLQATLMDGRLDFLNWTIKPDQMQTLVPFFGLIFLVLFDYVVYPLLRTVGIRKPLQMLTLSGLLACTAFILAAHLQMKIFVRSLFKLYTYYICFFFVINRAFVHTLKGNTTVIPSGEGRLHIYNAFDCNVSIRSSSLNVSHIDPLEMLNVSHAITSGKDDIVDIALLFDTTCTFVPEKFKLDAKLTVVEGEVNIIQLEYFIGFFTYYSYY